MKAPRFHQMTQKTLVALQMLFKMKTEYSSLLTTRLRLLLYQDSLMVFTFNTHDRIFTANHSSPVHLSPAKLAYVAGVKRGRGRGNLGARGRKEGNAYKETIVFSIFHAQILSVKIVIGQN